MALAVIIFDQSGEEGHAVSTHRGRETVAFRGAADRAADLAGDLAAGRTVAIRARVERTAGCFTPILARSGSRVAGSRPAGHAGGCGDLCGRCAWVGVFTCADPPVRGP